MTVSNIETDTDCLSVPPDPVQVRSKEALADKMIDSRPDSALSPVQPPPAIHEAASPVVVQDNLTAPPAITDELSVVNETATGTGSGIGSGIGSGTGSGSGSGIGSGTGFGSSSGNGSGTGFGSSSGNGSCKGSGSGTGFGSGSGGRTLILICFLL